MKSYSKIVAIAAIAAIASCYASGASLFNSISSALSSGTTAATTTQSTASSIASAVAAMIPAAPATSNATANNYMSGFTNLCSQALTAYKTNDVLKAAALYPQVQQMYNQGTSALSGLTGSEAKAATDWKSQLMGVVTSTVGSMVK